MVLVDDTSELLNVVSKGGLIQLAPKTYNISGEITVSVDGTRITASGGTIIRKQQECQIRITGNGCHIEGVKIDGNGQRGSGFLVTGSFNSLWSCWSENNGGHGFDCGGPLLFPGDDLTRNSCNFNEIRNCVAVHNGLVGIAQYHHWDGRIINNTCVDNGVEGITVDVWSLRALVMGNTLHNNCKSGGVGGIGMDFADLNRVANNFIEQPHKLPGITFQNNIGQSNYNIVSDNIIVNPGPPGPLIGAVGILLKANRQEDLPSDAVPLQDEPRTSNENLVINNIVRRVPGPLEDFAVLEEFECRGNDIRGNKLTS